MKHITIKNKKYPLTLHNLQIYRKWEREKNINKKKKLEQEFSNIVLDI